MESSLNFIELGPVNHTIAIGGGKGGVGKSLISSNLAISLAKLGKSVTLIDLDLGSANLHTCMGLKVPPHSLTDYLKGRVPFESLLSTTPLQKMNFVCGFNDSLDMADINSEQTQRLITVFAKIPSDFVILDLGAGTNNTTLDFFLSASKKVVAVTPEPTSIENAYRFIKSAFYRQLRKVEDKLNAQSIVAKAMDQKNQLGIRSPSDLIQHVRNSHPSLSQAFQNELHHFNIAVLLNQARTHEDRQLGHSISSVCRQYFGTKVEHLGYLDHDHLAWQALRRKRPLVIDCPQSSLAQQISLIARSLIDRQNYKAVV